MFSKIICLRNWWGSVAWLGFIFVICSLPASPLIKIQSEPKVALWRFLLSDPVGHRGMFGVLGVLLGWSLGRTFPQWGGGRVVLGLILLGFILGLITELYQLLVIPGRSFQLSDLVWDLIGLLIASGIFLGIKSYA